MALQTRKWDEELGRKVGVAALAAKNLKEATRLLHAGQLADLEAVPMPYSTVTYYAKQEAKRQAREAERNAPGPIDQRMDHAARRLMVMVEREIDRVEKKDRHDVDQIARIAAAIGKIKPLTKKDGPSPEDNKPSADPLTQALTRPSPSTPPKRRKKEAVAPTQSNKDTARAIEPDGEPNTTNATAENHGTSGVPASAAGLWSASVLNGG